MRGEAYMTGTELARMVATRAAIGVGLGFLLADAFPEKVRRAIGWTLLVGGAFLGATIALEIFGRPRPFRLAFGNNEECGPRAQPQPQSDHHRSSRQVLQPESEIDR